MYYVGIFAVLLLSGLGLPVPEEVTVIAAGVLSSRGIVNPWLALAVCWVGGIAGDSLVYFLGHHFGRSVVREHHWWVRYLTPEREARMERAVRQHGLKVLFSARFLVGVRFPVYLAAGILHVPFRRFLLLDMVSATAVIGTFFGVSYWFGATLTQWLRRAEVLVTLTVLLAAAVTALALWRRHARGTNNSS